MNIKPVQSPQLIKGALSGPASRGKSLFFGDKTGCTGCHKAPLFCDSLLHEAGVPDPYVSRTEWNTPSLFEAWRTGPYGHLGSLRSIREMMEVPGHNNPPTNLTSQEMDDLVAYVQSL